MFFASQLSPLSSANHSRTSWGRIWETTPSALGEAQGGVLECILVDEVSTFRAEVLNRAKGLGCIGRRCSVHNFWLQGLRCKEMGFGI